MLKERMDRSEDRMGMLLRQLGTLEREIQAENDIQIKEHCENPDADTISFAAYGTNYSGSEEIYSHYELGELVMWCTDEIGS